MTNIHLPRRGAGGKLEAFRAGHVFLLPQGATWLNQDKPRPFALASSCSPSRLGTIVYGSTRDTERQWNAACVVVTPSSAGVNANGLRASTFFYPGVMFPAAYGQLPAHTGFLAGALREFPPRIGDRDRNVPAAGSAIAFATRADRAPGG